MEKLINGTLENEWKELMGIAKGIGISSEEVRHFLRERRMRGDGSRASLELNK